MGLMPDIYDEAQRYRGCHNCQKLQAEIDHLRKRIGVIKANRNDLFDENVRLKEALSKCKHTLEG